LFRAFFEPSHALREGASLIVFDFLVVVVVVDHDALVR
jgi:hypothetical protein